MDVQFWCVHERDRRAEAARSRGDPDPDASAACEVIDAVAAATGGDVDALGRALEGLRRGERRAAGLWTTPLALAEQVVSRRPPAGVVVDPACGAGVFLVAVARARLEAGEPPERVAAEVVGLDRDPLAVRAAHHALRAVGVPTPRVRVADALDGPPWAPDTRAVVGNPPFVDSEGMVRAGAPRAELARRYGLRGNWDLACAFVVASARAVCDGGTLDLVLPNKLVAAPYAGSVRAVLRAGRIDALVDLAPDRWFAAAVQPVLLRWSAARGGPTLPVRRGPRAYTVPLSPDPTGPWPLLPVPPTPGTVPLGTLATCGDGATVAEAYALRDHLRDGPPGAGDVRVANSGTVDPLAFLWGDRALRYLGRRLERPVVPLEALPPRRRAQATSPKLVVASMTRRLEVAVDPIGAWYAAKSTVVVTPGAAPLAWLAVCLCSARASDWYRAVWGGLALEGGHLRVGARQLETVPVPPPDPLRMAEVRAALADGPDAARALGDALYAAAAQATR